MNTGNTAAPQLPQDLAAWSQAQYAQRFLSFVPLSGDAGFRKYFRAMGDGFSLIAVYAPPSTEKNAEFIAIAKLLCAHQLSVPDIIAYEADQGFMLLSDLGDKQLLPLLSENTVDGYYRSALEVIAKLHRIPKPQANLPLYDAKALQVEMDLFPQWFVRQLLGSNWDDSASAIFAELSSILIDSASSEQQVFVHRDFHSRNLMVNDGDIALIDFQDALWGPACYDVASILKDCYIQWPRQQQMHWLSYYHSLLPEQSRPDLASLTRQFDFIGLQRHIKVLGIFARLNLRDGKSQYLHDLPLVIDYTLDAANRYDETRVFAKWFEATLLPVIHQQSWFKA